MKYYVCMTDKFMSNWGRSDNKINKLVFVCENIDEAEIVYQNSVNRSDMARITQRTSRPYYRRDTHYTQYKTKQEYPGWYIKNKW